MIMVKTVCLVKIMIATGRKVQVKKIKALTVIRRSYPLHIAVVSYFSCFFTLFSDLLLPLPDYDTAQKMKFSIKDFFSKCDQIRIIRKDFFRESII